jgi:hypothetical protein
MPALFLLAGYVLTKWWDWAGHDKRAVRLWLPFLCTALIVFISFKLFINSLHPTSINYNKEVFSYVADAARKNNATLIIGTMDISDPNPPALDWHFITKEKLMFVTQSGVAMNLEEDRKLAHFMSENYFPEGIKNIVLPVVKRFEQTGRMRSIYLGLPKYVSYSRSQQGFKSFLQDMADGYSFDCIVVITSLEVEAQYPVDFIHPVLLETGFSSVATKMFTNSKVRVDVYNKILPSDS